MACRSAATGHSRPLERLSCCCGRCKTALTCSGASLSRLDSELLQLPPPPPWLTRGLTSACCQPRHEVGGGGRGEGEVTATTDGSSRGGLSPAPRSPSPPPPPPQRLTWETVTQPCPANCHRACPDTPPSLPLTASSRQAAQRRQQPIASCHSVSQARSLLQFRSRRASQHGTKISVNR